MQLTDFKALTFDCYGTLIDWEAGIIAGLQPLTSRLGGALTRNAILHAHARHESAQQIQTPGKRYSDILALVYQRLAQEWGVAAAPEEGVVYGQSVKNWRAFPDAVDALRYLKKYYTLAVLSNVDNASFSGSQARLQVEFDAVYTAEEIGSYKPDERNFDYMLARLHADGIEKHDVLHTAESLFHDHAPANRAGIASCWIYRRHDQDGFGATMPPGEMPRCDFTFNSMTELVDAHREAV